MAGVPSRVRELVQTFEGNIQAYRSQQYNEIQLRREFIDPFFEAFAAANVPADKARMHRQIDATNRQMHQLVYEPHRLTREAVKLWSQHKSN